MHIVQLVRNYGPVGGMETYVWYLCQQLAHAGHSLTVLCNEDQSSGLPNQAINVVPFGSKIKKPRWREAQTFDTNTLNWLEKNQGRYDIVHSHERTSKHDFVTFHGPPFATVKDKPFYKRISYRCYKNFQLEKKQVLCPGGKVIPVSAVIQDILRNHYPEAAFAEPIAPGVSVKQLPLTGPLNNPKRNIGFLGREWKRKGLETVVRVFKKSLQLNPDLKLVIAGMPAADISHLTQDIEANVLRLGNVEDTRDFYRNIDVLFHPAKMEPFGMVIVEALAQQRPVLLSDRCGAKSEITDQNGKILPLDSSDEAWSQALLELIQAPFEGIHYKRTWQHVAADHIALYARELN